VAQGLASPRPRTTPNLGHVRRTVRTLGLLQIDSVNVVERAHYLTLFSRLGAYDSRLLWEGLEQRRFFEYWGRMASICPIEHFPLYRHRMESYAAGEGRWITYLNAKAPGYVESVYQQVTDRGPLTVADLEEPGERSGPWWGWADGKIALEHLFAAGKVTVAFRRNFTRYYDVVERVIPSEYLDGPKVEVGEAKKRLILQAARALGVGTAKDIMDYNGVRAAEGRPAVEALVADGSLIEVAVEGWPRPGFLYAGSTIPRSVQARTLINPFDTYMWNRERVERLHNFHYRIEIYVPQPERVYGYYVFSFLLGDDLVARVDLKADRKAGTLRVPGAFLEEGRDRSHVAGELANELRIMANWLNLDEISIGRTGDLTAALRKAV
jgi:uncharacterized protein